MKIINPLVFFFSGAVLIIISFNWNYATEAIVFYGFANNKELVINLENAALVRKIHVKPGQKVKKGEVLVEVVRSSIAVTQSDIHHDISNLESQYQIWKSGLENSLRTLNAQKVERKNGLQSAINKLESEMEINENLIKDIASIEPIKDESGRNPSAIELDGLKSDLILSMKTFNTEIRKLENELSKRSNPYLIQIDKLSSNLEFVNEEEKEQNVTAPSDGVVGSIQCKVGENIPSFAPFLTVYEAAPNHVRGYVMESLLLNIEQLDTIIVQSVSHSDLSIEGVVIGMGSRIVEIPARLRKNPNFSTYGREIEIKIPSLNPFLQNEKVILKKITGKGSIGAQFIASFRK